MESMKANFTNEGGYDHRFRYLKNIMGLWMIQSVKKEFTEDLSFAQICEMASKETISSIVDCNDDCFLAPKSMIEAVQKFCRDTNQQVPETVERYHLSFITVSQSATVIRLKKLRRSQERNTVRSMLWAAVPMQGI